MQVRKTRKRVSAARAGSTLAVGALFGAAAGLGGGAIGGTPAGAEATGAGGGSTSDQCEVEKLEGPSGATSSGVTAGSTDGDEQVGYAMVDGETEATWWSGGDASDLLPDLEDASAAGVSDAIVVGTGVRSGESEQVSYLYYDGETRELEAPKGEKAAVRDINDEGVSVGHGSDGTALQWRLDAEDEPEALPSPHGDARAVSVDDDGSVGGSADGSETGTVPAVWDVHGEFTELPGLDDAEHGVVVSVRGDYAIGESGPSPDASSDVLWNLEQDSLTELPDSLEDANDVNPSGVVAGTTKDGRAAIVDDGEVSELPHLAGGKSRADAISDSGEVAGSSQDAAGNWHAVVWSYC